MSRLPVFWAPQPGPQKVAAICPCDEIFYGGTRGGGKALSYQALICTPFGWTKMQDLKIGSQITNPVTGGVERVIGLFPQGELEFYKITFDDGATIEASGDHLWAYKLPNRIRPGTKRSSQREYAVKELGGSQPNERWNNLRVGTTLDLLEARESGYNPRLPLTEPVLYSVNGRTGSGMDPYLLGLFFGDGCFSNFSISAADIETQKYLSSLGWNRTSNTIGWRAVGDNRRRLDQWLRNNGLSGFHAWEKFIPPYIQTADLEFRVAFLQGLMDTDGYVDERGRCYYCTTSKQLAEDVQQLVWGLGGKAWIREKFPTYTYKGEKLNGRVAYDLLIQLRKSSALFRLPRKKDRCTDSWNGGHELMREVVKIEPVGEKPAVCIRVNTVYGLYLAGDFIVTHNSDAAIGRQIRGATKWAEAWNGLILRHKYKDLGEIRRRIDELIKYGMPAERTGGANQTNYIKWQNGATITLSAIQHLEQADDWWGHQFTEISIDEAPSFPFIGLLIDKMKGSLRSPHGVPCHMFMTGNPGGPGAGIIVKTYIEPTAPGKINKILYNHPVYGQHTVTRIFIKSRLEDNQILMKADPNYIRKLLSLNDPVLRRAWLEGDWTAFIGQAFQFQEQTHVIRPVWPIPEWAPIFMTFDWGFGAPFSVGWWWVDGDGRIYRFAEWYGTDPNQPGVGMRLADPMIAIGILERELKMGILGRQITRIGGRDCFQRKPNYMGGGQGPATYDTFKAMEQDPDVIKRFGKVNLTLYPGDPDRSHKIRQFQTRIMVPQTAGEMPMLVVYDSCRDFIRTIPSLCMDDVKVEDLMDGQEDHVYDEACHICMARPLAASDEQISRNIIATMSRERDRKIDEVGRIAQMEFQRTVIKSAVASGTEASLTPELLMMLENSELDGEY